MGWESSGVVRFDLGSLLQGKMRNLKEPVSPFIGPKGFGQLIGFMCPKSFAGFRFDLGPLLQGEM